MKPSNNNWDIIDIATKASQWIELHFKKLLILFAVVIMTMSAWLYKQSVDRQNELLAFNDLYSVTKVYEERKTDFDQAKEASEQKDKKDTPVQTPKALASGDITKDYGDIIEKLQKFIEQNPGKNAVGEAALILSEIYAEYKMPDKGAATIESVLKNFESKNILLSVLQMRGGDLYALSNQCEKAVSLWELVAQSESFIKDQAQLKLGVCLEQIGKIDEAKKWFEKLSSQSPNSTEGFSAKRYLRFLEFKSRNGSILESGSIKSEVKKNIKDEKKS